jgi:hypothetical protein
MAVLYREALAGIALSPWVAIAWMVQQRAPKRCGAPLPGAAC